MMEINFETDGTTTIEGLDEADFMALAMIADCCAKRRVPNAALAAESKHLSSRIGEAYAGQRWGKLQCI